MGLPDMQAAPQDNREDLDLISDIVCMLHDMAHNLRTIGWHTALLQKDASLNDNSRTSANYIRSHISHLATLLEGALYLTKKKKKPELVLTSVNLSTDLENLFQEFTSRAKARQLAFSWKIGRGVPDEIYTDVTCLRRILSNLLSNALKFTGEGSIKLRFGYRENILTVQVSDTGEGVPKERQNEIFFPYNHQVTNHDEGSGLGLFSAKMLANRLGGDLNLIKSESGTGSVFQVTIINKEPIRNHDE